jgi:hypothetical protein
MGAEQSQTPPKYKPWVIVNESPHDQYQNRLWENHFTILASALLHLLFGDFAVVSFSFSRVLTNSSGYIASISSLLVNSALPSNI